MKRFLVAAALAASLFCLAPAAEAQDDQFQALVDKGLDQYRARLYDEAVVNFEAAYKIRQEPELLYNIARSYEKALKREQAIDAYKRFLELKGTTAELRANARAALDALEREKNAAENPPDTVPRDRVDPNQRNAVTGAQTTRPSGKSHTLEYTMMGVGGGAVAVGLIFTVLAFQANNNFDQTTDRDEQVRLRESTKDRALLADILVVGGVLVGGAGAVLYFVGGDDESGKVAAGPTFNGDTLAFTLAGTF